LGAVLAATGEAGGLALRWTGWLGTAGASFALGTLAFRFPRAAGLPILAAAGAGVFWAAGQLADFRPAEGALPPVVAQPMTDRELVTAFQKRVDWLELPEVPLLPRRFYRVRDGETAPSEVWWPWAEAVGWARSAGAPLPEPTVRFGLYRLELTRDPPVWRPVQPLLELSAP